MHAKKERFKHLLDLQFAIAFLAAPFLLFAYQFIYFGQISFHLISFKRLLMSVIVSPLIEEIIFRGFIQEWLYSHRWAKKAVFSISPANLITSFIFTAFHFFAHPPLMAALVFIPSLVFGYFRDRHGGITSPVILHCFYNLFYFSLFM